MFAPVLLLAAFPESLRAHGMRPYIATGYLFVIAGRMECAPTL